MKRQTSTGTSASISRRQRFIFRNEYAQITCFPKDDHTPFTLFIAETIKHFVKEVRLTGLSPFCFLEILEHLQQHSNLECLKTVELRPAFFISVSSVVLTCWRMVLNICLLVPCASQHSRSVFFIRLMFKHFLAAL